MTAQPQHEITEEIRQNLNRAGIGRRYHTRQLHEFGAIGDQLRDWIASAEFRPDIRLGAGRSLIGGTQAHDLFMVMARACYFRGVRSKVVSLSVLVHECEGRDISPEIEDVQALFITPFYRTDMAAPPMTDFQRLAVEDFLNERLDSARCVFTVSPVPLAETRLWWSDLLIQRLTSANIEVGV